MMTITIDLPMETGELVEKALDKARDDSRQAGARSRLPGAGITDVLALAQAG